MKKSIKALLLVVLSMVIVFSFVACGHTHTFDTEWTTTETHHYQASLCGHDVKLAEGEHQFGAAVENADGTATISTCRVCKYQKVEPIQHTHTYASAWTTDNDNHWKASTCGHDVKDSFGAHQFDAGVTSGNAIVYTCATCQYQKSEDLPPHVCQFSGEWNIEQPATIFASGLKTRACTAGGGCNEVESETIPQIEVVGITVKVVPNKTSYNAGEVFDAAGIKVVANGEDGSETDVTEHVTYSAGMLTKDDTHVIVTFQGKTASVAVSVVGDVDFVSVSQARQADVDTLLLVTGYFVGVADNGPNFTKEILLKDVANDNVIAVGGLPESYGTFPNVGYQKGDLVRIWGTIVVADAANTTNKKIVEFAVDANPASINDTIVSTGNKITYELDEVVVLDSWSDWQEFFSAETNYYTYVKLKGTVYANRYKSSTDNIMMSRVSMNASGTAVGAIKPDGKRCVSIRDNVMDANLGDGWKNYFQSPSTTGKYPGNAILADEITCLVTGGNSSYYQLTILEDSWFYVEGSESDDGTFTNADALVEVATAYYNQGDQIKYDQYAHRRHINISPEEATAQNIVYLDCSSFVNAVYYETFGVNILPYDIYASGGDAKTSNFRSYARDNQTAVDVVGYWVNADYTTTEEQDALLAQVKANLQVGDVLNYRHGNNADSGGHVYIYVGNDQFIHCTGSSYSYSSDAAASKDKGEMGSNAVLYISASLLFDRANSGQKRFLFYNTSSDQTVNFCVIRPMARGLTPTAETVARMANKGLDVEKTVAEGVNSAAYKEGTLTYTLTIKNKSTKNYKSVAIKEMLDSDVTFVESNTTHRLVGNELSFAVDIGAGKTVTVSWTVKVNANAATGSLIESRNTTVRGVCLATIDHTVSGYTKAQMQAVADKAKEFATEGKTFANPLEMAKTLYQQVLGATLFDYTSVEGIFDDLFVAQDASSNNSVVYTPPQLLDQAAILQMIPYGLYGGYEVSQLYWKNNELVRLVDDCNMALGDVIVAEDSSKSTTRVFVYVGDRQLVVIDSKTGTCQLQTMGTSYANVSHILVTLYAYDFYAVLRPSMVA